MRTDHLPENQLVTQITGLRAALDELKGSQRAGSANVKLGLTSSPNAYDLQISPPRTNGGLSVWQIAFQPARTSFADLGLCFQMTPTKVSDSGDGTGYRWTLQQLIPVNGQQLWRVSVINSSPSLVTWVRFKFYFYAIGAGSFSMTQIV
jgi:hypothetical protein